MTTESHPRTAPAACTRRKQTPPHRLLGFGLFAGVLVGLFGWAWSWRPKNWGEVVPGQVFRSGRSTPGAVERLIRAQQIAVVVDLTFPEGSALQEAEARACAAAGAEYVVCPLKGDGVGDVESYAKAVAALSEAVRDGRKAWVHCAAGAQRTGGATAFYRLLMERRSPAEVRAEMARYGWKPARDQVLWDYIAAHLPEVHRRLQQRGIASTMPNPWPPAEFPASKGPAPQAAPEPQVARRTAGDGVRR